jgi:hypothetical protein
VAHAYKWISPGPKCDQFLRSDAFVVGIKGPFGSGKSTTAVIKALVISKNQPLTRSKLDGKMRRHSRGAIVRNTYSELRTTTMKTWHSWVPKSEGRWVDSGPPTHHIIDDEIDMEVMFVSLDRPDDVKKLLGMELTWAWVNEGREMEKDIIDALTGRVGRYPSVQDGGCVDPQIFMDTNSMEVNHWWYVLAEQDMTTEKNQQLVESVMTSERELREAGVLRPDQRLFEFLSQPAGDGPDAENLVNLRPGYYAILGAGKTDEWRKVYIKNEYGFVQDGRPVYPEFRDSLHVKQFELNPRVPLYVGLDFGLTPAATIGQQTLSGIQRVRWEVVTERAGAVQFAQILKSFLNEHCAQFTIKSITGDPAGAAGSQTDSEQTVFSVLKANGVTAKPARTNDFTIRREVHAVAMSRIIDGEVGYQIHPQGCPYLRQGMAGQYRYRRVALGAGTERYAEHPEKNMFSHVCEADQYRMLGMGAGQAVVQGTIGQRNRPAYSVR